jgi:hypothetical protein
MSMEQQECYAVYHANDLLAMIAPQPEHWHTERSRHYTHVADVEAPLVQVFALTNHIDRPWTENPEVVWHTTAPVRSTSVGDVIVSQESGQAWLVMPFGLQELAPGHAEDDPSAREGERQDTVQPSDEGEEGRS